jgi:PhnB protein
MKFYQQCFGGELTIQTVGESPMAEQVPDAEKDKVMHANLTEGGLVLMAADMIDHDGMGNEKLVKGNVITLSLDCSSDEELRTFFSSLSAGGQVTMPLEEQFWGSTFGMLTDKYGMNWMLNFDKTANA